MDIFEKVVRIICSIAIVILSIYIGIKLFPFLPDPIRNGISHTTNKWTQSAIEQFDLLAGYASEEPEYPSTIQEFVVSVLDAPIGIYTYLTSQKDENGQSFVSEGESTVFETKSTEKESIKESAMTSERESTTIESTEQVVASQSEEQTSGAYEGELAEVVNLLPIQANVVSDIITLSQNGTIPLNSMLDYQYLIKNFYVVDSSTSVSEDVLNPTKLLSKDLTITKNTNEPQILIYHTHSQEAYIDSVEGDVSQTIVGVGNYLTDILTNQYGYNVLHHTGVYDMEDGKLDRSQAYNRALPAIEAILQNYPSIEVVIDLHRDGVAEDVHLVTEVNGKKVARLMFFNGLCRDTNGELAGVSNPYREDNLAFSLQMGLHLKTAYPDVLRVLYLQKNRYNQHLASRCILVETGAQTNTVEEAMNAMEILAEILNDVLS